MGVRRLTREERADFAAFLATLSPGQWQAATFCAWYIWVVAAVNGGMWLVRILPALTSGGQPGYLQGTGMTTNIVFVQDLALWVPLNVVVAAWLWARAHLAGGSLAAAARPGACGQKQALGQTPPAVRKKVPNCPNGRWLHLGSISVIAPMAVRLPRMVLVTPVLPLGSKGRRQEWTFRVSSLSVRAVIASITRSPARSWTPLGRR
jgi:hypothetical protein